VFFFSFAFLVLSALWIVLRITMGGINLLFTRAVDQIILAIGSLSFLVALWSMRKLLEEIRYELNEIREIENTIKDYYRYERLMDPSDMDN